MLNDCIDLNNRELSLLIWIGILPVFMIINKNLRDSLVQLIKIFLKLWIIWLLMATYIGLSIIFLDKLRFWENFLIKETVVWSLGTAVVLLVNYDKSRKDSDYFKNILKDSLKLIIIYKFIINLKTFGFVVEFIMLPFLVFLFSLNAISQLYKKYKPVKKLTDGIIGIFGIFIFIKTAVYLVKYFPSYINGTNVKEFLLPTILTILYLPFLYFATLFSLYENVFVRYKIWFREKGNLL